MVRGVEGGLLAADDDLGVCGGSCIDNVLRIGPSGPKPLKYQGKRRGGSDD